MQTFSSLSKKALGKIRQFLSEIFTVVKFIFSKFADMYPLYFSEKLQNAVNLFKRYIPKLISTSRAYSGNLETMRTVLYKNTNSNKENAKKAKTIKTWYEYLRTEKSLPNLNKRELVFLGYPVAIDYIA